jgi:hypothetical protein
MNLVIERNVPPPTRSPELTRPYCASRLLEHGPLTFPQFQEITGWPKKTARYWLDVLIEEGEVRQFRQTGMRARMAAVRQGAHA